MWRDIPGRPLRFMPSAVVKGWVLLTDQIQDNIVQGFHRQIIQQILYKERGRGIFQSVIFLKNSSILYEFPHAELVFVNALRYFYSINFSAVIAGGQAHTNALSASTQRRNRWKKCWTKSMSATMLTTMHPWTTCTMKTERERRWAPVNIGRVMIKQKLVIVDDVRWGVEFFDFRNIGYFRQNLWLTLVFKEEDLERFDTFYLGPWIFQSFYFLNG